MGDALNGLTDKARGWRHPAAVGGESNIRGTMEDRRACPHWQAVGCLSDTLEKLCESKSDAESRKLLRPDTGENVWLCCCPNPYEPCPVAQRSRRCDAVLLDAFREVAGGQASTREVVQALLRARHSFREDDPTCAHALVSKDYVKGKGDTRAYCGTEAEPPLTRAVAHPGVFCETVTWQWEELGDGDESEFRANGCPIPTKPRVDDNTRKGGTDLSGAIPPDIAKVFGV